MPRAPSYCQCWILNHIISSYFPFQIFLFSSNFIVFTFDKLMWNRRKYLIKADTSNKNLNKKVSSINLVFSDDTKYQKGSFLKIYSYLHFINRDCINNKYNEKKLVPPAHISLANVWHKNSTFYLGVLTSLRPMRGENSDPEPIRAECLRRHHFHPLVWSPGYYPSIPGLASPVCV